MTDHRRPRSGGGADDDASAGASSAGAGSAGVVSAGDARAYDPLLPILAELEEHVRRSARAAEAAAGRAAHPHAAGEHPSSRAPAPHPSRTPAPAGGPRALGTASRRLLRRGAILALLGCTVGATATAITHTSSRPGEDAAIVAASGGVDGSAWTLQVRRRDGRLCPSLVVTGPAAGASLATDCVARPGPTVVLPTSAPAPGRIVVGGLTGRRVRSVRVRVAGRPRTVATRPLAGDDAVRTFAVAVRASGRATTSAAVLRALDGRGRPIGAALRDCSAAPRAARCTP
jgi:hypothetical protein